MPMMALFHYCTASCYIILCVYTNNFTKSQWEKDKINGNRVNTMILANRSFEHSVMIPLLA